MAIPPREIRQIIANLLCEDLKPVELSQAFAQWMNENGWDGNQLAAVLALKLQMAIQSQADKGQVSARLRFLMTQLLRGNISLVGGSAVEAPSASLQ